MAELREKELGADFVKLFSGTLVETIHNIVLAYASSPNCQPEKIPNLYADLFALFKKGTIKTWD